MDTNEPGCEAEDWRLVLGKDRRGDDCLHITDGDGRFVLTVWCTPGTANEAKAYAKAMLEKAVERVRAKGNRE